jgi:hypothetical protein
MWITDPGGLAIEADTVRAEVPTAEPSADLAAAEPMLVGITLLTVPSGSWNEAAVLRGVMLSAAGLALGIASAWVLSRTMSKLLFGAATDPGTSAAMAGVLSLIAAAACWIPARRAVRIDPISVLREE